MFKGWKIMIGIVLAMGKESFANPGMMNTVYGTTKRYVHGIQQAPHHLPYWPAYPAYPSYWTYANPYQQQQLPTGFEMYGGYLPPRDHYLQMYPMDSHQYQRPYGYIVYDDTPLEGEDPIEEDTSMDPIDELEEEYGRETWYEQPAAPAAVSMQHLQQPTNQIGWYDNYYYPNDDMRLLSSTYNQYQQPPPYMQQAQVKRADNSLQKNQAKQGMKEVAMLRPPVPMRRIDDVKMMNKFTEAAARGNEEPQAHPEHETQSVYDAIKQLFALNTRITNKDGNETKHKSPQKRFVSSEESLESELTRLKKLSV